MNLLRVNHTRETLTEPISTHISKTMNQTQDRIKLLEYQYRKTDQFIISDVHLLEAKQNEMQLEDFRMVTEVMENYRNKEAGQSSLVLAKAPAVIENHRDYRGRKL